MYVCIYIYVYIYIYIWVMSYPPLLFDHPAIYKTSWRAGETIALVYNYANKSLHMKNRNHSLISKRLLPIVRNCHELFVFVRKALPSIVRELFLL